MRFRYTNILPHQTFHNCLINSDPIIWNGHVVMETQLLIVKFCTTLDRMTYHDHIDNIFPKGDCSLLTKVDGWYFTSYCGGLMMFSDNTTPRKHPSASIACLSETVESLSHWIGIYHRLCFKTFTSIMRHPGMIFHIHIVVVGAVCFIWKNMFKMVHGLERFYIHFYKQED